MVRNLKEILSINLIKLRKLKGFNSQADIAEKAEMPVGTYQNIERGTAWPHYHNLQKIAEALGVHEAELMRDEEAGITPREALDVLSRLVNSHEKQSDPSSPENLFRFILSLDDFQRDALMSFLSGAFHYKIPAKHKTSQVG